MARFIERVLAKIDNLIGWDYETRDGEERIRDFYTSCGRRMIIIDREGSVRARGNSWWIFHVYDNKGNLKSRGRMRDTVQEGERIAFGFKVYEAYQRAKSSFLKKT